MNNVIYPPTVYSRKRTTPSIFLAGSIDNGKAEDWQTTIINALHHFDVDILNPRRKDWDSSWEQKITNPKFKEQVLWELDGLNRANLIVMYFAPGSVSPISLLELGLYARERKMIIFCNEKFWRKGNVDIVAEIYDIPVIENMDDFIFRIKEELLSIG
jgi:hypothetical protein